MALSPRELPHFFPGTPLPRSGQRLQGPMDFRNLALAIPKLPVYPQVDPMRFQDGNISSILQHLLLNTLRDAPRLLQQNTMDFYARFFPTTPPINPPVSESYKHDFLLQDLHQKYKKLLAEYELNLKRKLRLNNNPPDFNCFNSKLHGQSFSTTFSQFPYLNSSFYFPLPPPPLDKCHKPSILQIQNQLYPVPSRNSSPQMDAPPKTTIHHRSPQVKEDMTSQERPQTTESLKDKKTHKCMYCGKLYSRKYGLKIHIRTHTGYKPLKCKVCGRAFGDPSNLNKHVRLHAEGETPYRCEFCGKVLVRRRDLERHVKSRHPNTASKGELFSV